MCPCYSGIGFGSGYQWGPRLPRKTAESAMDIASRDDIPEPLPEMGARCSDIPWSTSQRNDFRPCATLSTSMAQGELM
jgi:hypothetical protein